MDKADYWILDSVLEHPVSMFWLSAPIDECELMFNRDHHGLTKSVLVQKLYSLWQHGDLQFFKRDVLDEEAISSFTPTFQDLEDALDGRLHLNYALTTQGGARWERISHPDWRRYLSTRSDKMYEEIIAADRHVAEEYLELIPYITGDETVVAESINWGVMQPWHATYWKLLPIGHSVRFRTTTKEFSPPPAWFHEKWRSLLQWHTNYLAK